MQRCTRRLALLGTAVLTLGILGAGTVMAASPAPSAGSAAGAKAAVGPLAKIARHVVHGTVVIQRPDGTLQTLQIDRGTVASISGSALTINEPGGSQTVTTDARTRVRRNGAKSTVASLAVGDKVIVVSELRGGTAVAQQILVPRPHPTTLPAQATP
jgi:hypothetical protein